MLTRREAIIGTISASLKYDEAGLFAEHPTDAERIARLADDFAQVWTAKAAEARAAVETPDHLGDLGIVNVRVYGAVGDGVTDDTAAIQAAIDAIGESVGGALWIPDGRYFCPSSIELPEDVSMIGSGYHSVIDGASITFNSRCRIESLQFSGNGSGKALVSGTDDVCKNAVIRGCWFDALDTGIYLERGPASKQSEGVQILNNVFAECTTSAVFAIRANGALVQGNVMGYAGSRPIQFYGGQRNRIIGNRVTAGITGIGFIFQRSTAGVAGTPIGNVIANNIVEGYTEEGITFDCRGNVAADISVVDWDEIASTSGTNQIVLDHANWADAGSPFAGYAAVFISGALQGTVCTISAQSGATLTTDLSTTELGKIVAGDEVVIGLPAYGNLISGNHVDGRNGTSGIVLWGNALGNSITGNTVLGSNAGISLSSLSSLIRASNNVTGNTGRAPVAFNTVVGNTLMRTVIQDQFYDYGSDAYSPGDDTVSGNTEVP